MWRLGYSKTRSNAEFNFFFNHDIYATFFIAFSCFKITDTVSFPVDSNMWSGASPDDNVCDDVTHYPVARIGAHLLVKGQLVGTNSACTIITVSSYSHSIMQ